MPVKIIKLETVDVQNLRYVGGSALERRSENGWHIDGFELARAKAKLGIELTVMVRYTSGLQETHGHRIYRLGGSYWHQLRISQQIGVFSANKALWRMLAHAAQAERWAREMHDTTFTFYYKLYKGKRYEINEWEQLADFVADDNADTWLATF